MLFQLWTRDAALHRVLRYRASAVAVLYEMVLGSCMTKPVKTVLLPTNPNY